jgi:hypothetical protein
MPQGKPVEPGMDPGLPSAGDRSGPRPRDAERNEARHDVEAVQMVLKLGNYHRAPFTVWRGSGFAEGTRNLTARGGILPAAVLRSPLIGDLWRLDLRGPRPSRDAESRKGARFATHVGVLLLSGNGRRAAYQPA